MKYISENGELRTALLERFLKYVRVWTESSSEKADAGLIPSEERERDLARILAEEMKAIGMQNVCITDECYTYGALPASSGFENAPPFCLLAHVDTVEEVTGKNVNPLVHENYDGAPIALQCGVTLNCKNDAYLAQAALERDTIITTDGTTLLGADDKAGVAEIMTALSYLSAHPELKHGAIEVVFSPDEETGHGMDKVPLHLLKSKFAYTVDGGHIGELETECFNAYGAEVVFTGKSTHTGDARKNALVNAASIASRFAESLPIAERPETTDGYEGFFGLMEIQANIETARVYLILRDFSESGMQRRIDLVKRLADIAAESFGGKAEVRLNEQYKNMKAVLDAAPHVVRYLEKAYVQSEVAIVKKPIRGGTDGTRLTEMGIPTPNIFTGGHNYHSRSEWASLSQMCAAADVLVNLARAVAGESDA
ncbi:MAG: peptidase T [Treponema sp.]